MTSSCPSWSSTSSAFEIDFDGISYTHGLHHCHQLWPVNNQTTTSWWWTCTTTELRVSPLLSLGRLICLSLNFPKIIKVSLKARTLKFDGQLIVIAINLVLYKDGIYDLAYKDVFPFILTPYDLRIRWYFSVAEIVFLSFFNYRLKFKHALSCQKDVVISQYLCHVEFIRFFYRNILEITCCKFKVIVIGSVRYQKQQLIDTIRSDNCFEQLSFGVLQLLRINDDKFVFK